MRTIELKAFEAICLELIDEVERSGQTLSITKNGIPTWQLQPVLPGEYGDEPLSDS